MRRFTPLTLLLVCGCAASTARAGNRTPGMYGALAPTPTTQEVPLAIVALPGGLDATRVFNSNSPEIVMEAGITLSTLPGDPAVHQNVAFQGAFTVFSHHIAKDAVAGDRLLRLGLLARNLGTAPVLLQRVAGASYVSQPEAPFIPLANMLPDPDGHIWAGPGDRVSGVLLHDRTSMAPASWTVPPGGTVLVYDLPISTDVAIPPPINGRTTQLILNASGPMHLAEVAAFAPKTAAGFADLTQADFERVLAQNTLAGPRDLAAVPFDPAGKPPKGFRYGRVAGVSVGDRWVGAVTPDLQPGEKLGMPVSGLYLNRLGTGQNQSAKMLSRYADTAYQAHGNYGVSYDLEVALTNPSDDARTWSFTLSHPSRILGDQPARAAVYLNPPNKPVMFRGAVRTAWTEGTDLTQHFAHLVLRHGEAMPPFETVTLKRGESRRVQVKLIYPADATPPQLLTIERVK